MRTLAALAALSALSVAWTATVLVCDAAEQREPSTHGARPSIALDERAVLTGRVLERLEGDRYVYLRLSVIADSAHPKQRAHAVRRWVALHETQAGPGARLRLRSLGRRAQVWDAELERSFEALEYVAELPVP